jgi:predicted regulator of Ras-like GTPase activity (Roadblock/LC7/MglB family)
MKLDPEFYHNLLNTLSQNTHTPIVPESWASSEGLIFLMKKLQEDANSRHVFIIERTGKQAASYGDLGYIDTTDLVALIVGKILACDALANLVNGTTFSAISVESKQWGAYLSALGKNAILIVVFDHQTNVDRVGTRVRRAIVEIAEAMAVIESKYA